MITFDGLFLGRLGAGRARRRVARFPVVMLIQQTANERHGRRRLVRDRARARRRQARCADALVFHTFLLALGLAAIFSTVLLLGAPFVFRWMGGHGEMLSAALAYANVAFSGAVSICMLNLLGSAVRGTGNMGLPAAVIVGSVLAHIAHLAGADFRMGTVAGAWSGRRRLGPDDVRSAPAASC